MNGSVPPPPPGAEAPKKGLSTLAKVLIGCGVVMLLGIGSCVVVTGYLAKKGINKLESFAKEMESDPDAAAYRVAELAIRANPDLTIISSDADAKTITIRDKDGSEITLTIDDLKAGRFTVSEGGETATVDFDADEQGGGTMTVTSDKGTMVLGAGDASQVPGWVPTYPGARADSFSTVKTGSETSGTFALHTADSAETVLAFFEEKLEADGFKVEKMTGETTGALGGTLTATSGSRTVNVTVVSQEGETQGLIAYGEKP
jgi:hypothetical protein